MATVTEQALPVLVYDGDCAFCTTAARWGQRRLRLPNVEPWQALDLETLGLTEQECDTAVQWVAPDGTVRSGHRAVAAAVSSSGRWFAPFGRVIEWPVISPVMALAYRTVAKNRHRMPGATEACRLDG